MWIDTMKFALQKEILFGKVARFKRWIESIYFVHHTWCEILNTWILKAWQVFRGKYRISCWGIILGLLFYISHTFIFCQTSLLKKFSSFIFNTTLTKCNCDLIVLSSKCQPIWVWPSLWVVNHKVGHLAHQQLQQGR